MIHTATTYSEPIIFLVKFVVVVIIVVLPFLFVVRIGYIAVLEFSLFLIGKFKKSLKGKK